MGRPAGVAWDIGLPLRESPGCRPLLRGCGCFAPEAPEIAQQVRHAHRPRTLVRGDEEIAPHPGNRTAGTP